jgi:hypothetical protein
VCIWDALKFLSCQYELNKYFRFLRASQRSSTKTLRNLVARQSDRQTDLLEPHPSRQTSPATFRNNKIKNWPKCCCLLRFVKCDYKYMKGLIFCEKLILKSLYLGTMKESSASFSSVRLEIGTFFGFYFLSYYLNNYKRKSFSTIFRVASFCYNQQSYF